MDPRQLDIPQADHRLREPFAGGALSRRDASGRNVQGANLFCSGHVAWGYAIRHPHCLPLLIFLSVRHAPRGFHI